MLERFRKLHSSLWPALAFLAVVGRAHAVEKDRYLDVRESMIAISRQLGVTCAHCHDVNNFEAPDKLAFKTARSHMRIVQLLNSQQGFAGKPKADCFMCHRGEARYEYKENDRSKKE